MRVIQERWAAGEIIKTAMMMTMMIADDDPDEDEDEGGRILIS